MIYNSIILIFSIPCTILLAGLLVGLADICRAGMLADQHIYLLLLSMLYYFIHYSVLVWGMKRRLLNKKTVRYLCITDALFWGYLFLSALTTIEHTLADFIGLVIGEQLAVEHTANLIVNFIVLFAVSLRIAFVVLFAKLSNSTD